MTTNGDKMTARKMAGLKARARVLRNKMFWAAERLDATATGQYDRELTKLYAVIDAAEADHTRNRLMEPTKESQEFEGMFS